MKQAISFYEEALSETQDRFAALIELGDVYMNMEDMSKAVEMFNEALTLNARSEEPHLKLMEAYYRVGDCTSSQHHAEEALKLNPLSERADAGLVKVYHTVNDRPRCIAYALSALKRHPGSEAISIELAAVYQLTRDWPNTIQTLRNAMRQNPRSEILYSALAWAYIDMKDYPEAERHCRTFMKRFPELSTPHRYMAILHGSMDRPKDAIREYKECLRIEPQMSLALQEFVDICAKTGRWDKVKEAVDEIPLVRGNPLYPALVRLLDHAGREAAPGTVEDLVRDSIYRADKAIHALARKHGATLILAGYPGGNFEATMAYARDAGVPYVDFTKIFEERFTSPDEWLGYDKAHCNTRGYGLMAEVLAARIGALAKDEDDPQGNAAPLPK